MCGENYSTPKKHRMLSGSPPRVRGKPASSRTMIWSARITPACAGKTLFRDVLLDVMGDHPRVCGENYPTITSLISPKGSPPRVRGKLLHGVGHFLRDRITPACAGKTAAVNLSVRLTRDHPRVCGENIRRLVRHEWSLGSPPRVRGKLADFSDLFHAVRITPACAGKTPEIRCFAADF